MHSKSYADNGVAGHVSNCKLMFSSETEDLNTKMFTKTMNFPVNNLDLVSLCTKNLTFKTWNWFLIKKNGRSRPYTTSETHNDRISFCCSLKPICFGRYEQSIPGKDHLINGFWIFLFIFYQEAETSY